jgi:hypothetical protein
LSYEIDHLLLSSTEFWNGSLLFPVTFTWYLVPSRGSHNDILLTCECNKLCGQKHYNQYFFGKNMFAGTLVLRSGIDVKAYNTLVEEWLSTLDNFSSINRSFAGTHAGMLWLKKYADCNDTSFKILNKLNQHQ